MKITDDHTGEIYKILDQSGLSVGNLMDSKRPMSRIVNSIRTDAAKKIDAYINKLEAVRQIEVSDE